MIQEAISSFDDYKKANSQGTVLTHLIVYVVPIKWQSPPLGVFIINWDAAIDSSYRRIGLGVIIRDCEGQVIAAKSQTICVLQDPIIA